MGNALQKLRHFLLRWVNREFLIFLFFLIVAGIFWLLMTLNENFEQELKIPVRYVNVPKNVVITSSNADSLRVTIRDKGISLITYLYSKEQQAVIIDFNRYAHDNGTGSVPAADMMKFVNSRLPASAKAISIKPETTTFYFNNGEKKLVPVVYQGKVEPDMLYFISDISYSSDSITVYASEEKLDSIDRIYTEPLHYEGFRDSLVVNARLRHIEGAKLVPDEVTIRFATDMLTEVSINDIPIVGINMPKGTKLRTFPAKLSVSFVTGMKNYQNMSASDFLIIADYNEIETAPSSLCNVYLRRQPEGIQRVKLEKQQVDYLIEEHLEGTIP